VNAFLRHVVFWLKCTSALKMEVACSSETLAPNQKITRRSNPEDNNLISCNLLFYPHFIDSLSNFAMEPGFLADVLIHPDELRVSTVKEASFLTFDKFLFVIPRN
jgi:hypothetical protein